MSRDRSRERPVSIKEFGEWLLSMKGAKPRTISDRVATIERAFRAGRAQERAAVVEYLVRFSKQANSTMARMLAITVERGDHTVAEELER